MRGFVDYTEDLQTYRLNCTALPTTTLDPNVPLFSAFSFFE